MKGKRAQLQYSLVQQHLPGLILGTTLRVAEDLGDPYQAKPGLGGMVAYQPKSMAVVCILMEAEASAYRRMGLAARCLLHLRRYLRLAVHSTFSARTATRP